MTYEDGHAYTMLTEASADAPAVEPPDASDASIRSDPNEPQADVPPATRQRQLAAVKHGLYLRSQTGLQLRSRRVRRLAAKVRAALPWLQPSDEPAVRGWCELEIITARLFRAVLEKGEPGAMDLYRRMKTLQLAYERELGMTPASRAELGLTVTKQVQSARDIIAEYDQRRQEPQP